MINPHRGVYLIKTMRASRTYHKEPDRRRQIDVGQFVFCFGVFQAIQSEVLRLYKRPRTFCFGNRAGGFKPAARFVKSLTVDAHHDITPTGCPVHSNPGEQGA